MLANQQQSDNIHQATVEGFLSDAIAEALFENPPHWKILRPFSEVRRSLIKSNAEKALKNFT